MMATHVNARCKYLEIVVEGKHRYYQDWIGVWTGLDRNPNSARTILSHAHPSTRAGFLKTLIERSDRNTDSKY